MDYPITLEIIYETDEEYRDCLCQLLKIDDDDSFNLEYLDFIYSKTETIPIFADLYEIAAGTMMSTDKSFGLAVLFSFTYLMNFHKCLVIFFKDPNSNLELNDDFITLFQSIKR
jgi:hypothetical protein